jgi:anti-sigma B factor antagonist
MEIAVTSIEECDLVVVKGRIDSYTAPNLSETLSEITQRDRCKVIMDMSDVSYETLELAGFVPLFNFFQNVESALAYF